MPINCECVEKLSICCPCKLNVVGYISGWLGIVWRTIIVALLSSTLSNITVDDPSIYSIFLVSCLVYFLASCIINSIFLYGIHKERRHFLLPYITIVAVEMAIGVIISSGMAMLLFAINAIALAVYIVCIAVLITSVHFVLWLYNILFYKDLEHEAMIRYGRKDNVALTRMNSIDI